MGIGVSVFLLAAGAVMTFAVEVENAEGFNINTIGIILMIAGAIGLITSMLIFGRRDRAVGTADSGRVVETRREVI
ncbi:MAG: hypothetical protein ABL966_09130 [Acidimicrobiales bacterium]